jgi:hypothetical protein
MRLGRKEARGVRFAWGGAMATYRIYCLDGVGHISLADWVIADTDEEAISKARSLRRGAQKCELWLKSRLIARISHEGALARVDA